MVLALLDSPEFAVSFLACLRIGAIAVLVNPLLPWRDIGVVDRRRGATARARLGGAAEGSEEVSRRGCHGTAEWDEVAAAKGDTEHGCRPRRTRPGFWLCTSGSTGRPKLAMHRHGDLEVTADTYARSVLDIGAGRRFFSVGPMFHTYGLGNSLTFPMAVGAMPVARADSDRRRLPRIARDRQSAPADTVLRASPRSIAALNASSIPDDTFRSVRLGVSAAEALPAETLAPLPRPLRRRDPRRHRLDRDDAHLPVEPPRSVRPGTTGSAVSGYEVARRRRRGRRSRRRRPRPPLGARRLGGVGLLGNAACDRVRPSAWEVAGCAPATLRARQGGHVHLPRSIGRHAPRSAASGSPPAEVEATIIEHPSVLEVAIVGELDDRGITRPVAYVVAKPGASVTETEVIEHAGTGSPGSSGRAEVVLMETLPKTATGKIQRFKLRQSA